MTNHQPPPFAVDHGTMLRAFGDDEQIVVFRSPVVKDDDSMMREVQEHIREHGMALLDERETSRPPNEYGITSMTQLVYATPGARLAAYGTES
jgi:hypothetical protein